MNINDTLVTAASLKEQTGPLVELHGQHEHQTLLDPQSHLTLLDEFAALEPEKHTVAEAFRDWRRLQSELDAFQMDEREKAARLDLLTFQVGELTRAALRPAEDEDLETSRRVLSNAEKLQRLCDEAYGALYESDEAALGRLGTVWKRVAELADVDPAFQPHLDARDAIKSQLEDLAISLRSYGENIDASPAKLQEVEDRLALIDRLKRKYGPTLPDVIGARDVLERQLNALTHSDERKAGLAAESQAAREGFLKRARGLSGKRRQAAVEFARRLQDLLGELAMGRTKLEVRFEAEAAEAAWTEQGIDIAECYLSANVGEDLRPLAKIASGGELPRDAGDSDAGGGRHAGQDADLRRNRRRHRRAGGGRGGEEPQPHRRHLSGALHHAPSANRGQRALAFSNLEIGGAWPNANDRDQARARRPNRRSRAYDGGAAPTERGPGGRAGAAGT